MSQVKLILRDDVANLGEAGDLVTAKPGYAHNYLIPQGKADFASESKVRQLEHQRRVIEARQAKDLKDLQAVDHRIRSTPLEVSAKAGEEGKLFGSITSSQIAELLAAKGVEIDRRKIVLPEPIKSLGEHTVAIRLRREVVSEVKLVVRAEE